MYLLDHQLLDADGRRCGKVDDIALEGAPGGDFEVVAILCGPGVWRARAGVIGRIAAWSGRRWSRPRPVRRGGRRRLARQAPQASRTSSGSDAGTIGSDRTSRRFRDPIIEDVLVHGRSCGRDRVGVAASAVATTCAPCSSAGFRVSSRSSSAARADWSTSASARPGHMLPTPSPGRPLSGSRAAGSSCATGTELV